MGAGTGTCLSCNLCDITSCVYCSRGICAQATHILISTTMRPQTHVQTESAQYFPRNLSLIRFVQSGLDGSTNPGHVLRGQHTGSNNIFAKMPSMPSKHACVCVSVCFARFTTFSFVGNKKHTYAHRSLEHTNIHNGTLNPLRYFSIPLIFKHFFIGKCKEHVLLNHEQS